MMVECWFCNGQGDLKVRDSLVRTICKACAGTGKLHDDADAWDQADKEFWDDVKRDKDRSRVEE